MAESYRRNCHQKQFHRSGRDITGMPVREAQESALMYYLKYFQSFLCARNLPEECQPRLRRTRPFGWSQYFQRKTRRNTDYPDQRGNRTDTEKPARHNKGDTKVSTVESSKELNAWSNMFSDNSDPKTAAVGTTAPLILMSERYVQTSSHMCERPPFDTIHGTRIVTIENVNYQYMHGDPTCCLRRKPSIEISDITGHKTIEKKVHKKGGQRKKSTNRNSSKNQENCQHHKTQKSEGKELLDKSEKTKKAEKSLTCPTIIAPEEHNKKSNNKEKTNQGVKLDAAVKNKEKCALDKNIKNDGKKSNPKESEKSKINDEKIIHANEIKKVKLNKKTCTENCTDHREKVILDKNHGRMKSDQTSKSPPGKPCQITKADAIQKQSKKIDTKVDEKKKPRPHKVTSNMFGNFVYRAKNQAKGIFGSKNIGKVKHTCNSITKHVKGNDDVKYEMKAQNTSCTRREPHSYHLEIKPMSKKATKSVTIIVKDPQIIHDLLQAKPESKKLKKPESTQDEKPQKETVESIKPDDNKTKMIKPPEDADLSQIDKLRLKIQKKHKELEALRKLIDVESKSVCHELEKVEVDVKEQTKEQKLVDKKRNNSGECVEAVDGQHGRMNEAQSQIENDEILLEKYELISEECTIFYCIYRELKEQRAQIVKLKEKSFHVQDLETNVTEIEREKANVTEMEREKANVAKKEKEKTDVSEREKEKNYKKDSKTPQKISRS